jgi:hypothetical protein
MKIENPPPNLSSQVVRVEQVTMNSKSHPIVERGKGGLERTAFAKEMSFGKTAGRGQEVSARSVWNPGDQRS